MVCSLQVGMGIVLTSQLCSASILMLQTASASCGEQQAQNQGEGWE